MRVFLTGFLTFNYAYLYWLLTKLLSKIKHGVAMKLKAFKMAKIIDTEAFAKILRLYNNKQNEYTARQVVVLVLNHTCRYLGEIK